MSSEIPLPLPTTRDSVRVNTAIINLWWSDKLILDVVDFMKPLFFLYHSRIIIGGTYQFKASWRAYDVTYRNCS